MKKQEKRMIISFLSPSLILFCLIFVYPLIRTALMSFFEVSDITGSVKLWNFTGLENYKALLNSMLYMTSLKNIFFIWLYGGIFGLSLSLLFAVIINSGIKGKKFFKAVLYLPHIISAVALATMWLQYVYNARYGLLTNLFKSMGLKNLASIAWLDADHKFWAMLVAYCYGSVGYHMLIFSSGIEKIPKELYEAAIIDGTNSFSQFFHITLPLIMGELKTNITMWSISVLGFMVWGQLFSSVDVDLKTVSPVIYLYLHTFGGEGFTDRNAGIGAAIGVMMGVLVIIIFAIINRVFRNKDDFEL